MDKVTKEEMILCAVGAGVRCFSCPYRSDVHAQECQHIRNTIYKIINNYDENPKVTLRKAGEIADILGDYRDDYYDQDRATSKIIDVLGMELEPEDKEH